jgi:hypothetical protein
LTSCPGISEHRRTCSRFQASEMALPIRAVWARLSQRLRIGKGDGRLCRMLMRTLDGNRAGMWTESGFTGRVLGWVPG